MSVNSINRGDVFHSKSNETQGKEAKLALIMEFGLKPNSIKAASGIEKRNVMKICSC